MALDDKRRNISKRERNINADVITAAGTVGVSNQRRRTDRRMIMRGPVLLAVARMRRFKRNTSISANAQHDPGHPRSDHRHGHPEHHQHL